MAVFSSGYCHIVGLSKAQPKSHFIPMMPALSQREQAQLFGCKITMAAFMDHHYVPVIEYGKGKSLGVTSCKITGHQAVSIRRQCSRQDEALLVNKHLHRFRADYRYMEPFVNRMTNNGEKMIISDLIKRMGEESKLDSSQFFVYPLNDKRTGKTGLVLSYEYEEAIRNGTIEHIMLSGDGNKLVVRIRDGPICTIPMDKISKNQIEQLSINEMIVEGQGPSREILDAQRREKAAREKEDREQMASYLAEMETKRRERERKKQEQLKETMKRKLAEAEEAERRQKERDEEIRKQYEDAARIRAEAEEKREAARLARLAEREKAEAEAAALRAEQKAKEAEERARLEEEQRVAEEEARLAEERAAASALVDVIPEELSVNELIDHMRDKAGDTDIIQCMEEGGEAGMSSKELVDMVSVSAYEAIQEEYGGDSDEDEEDKDDHESEIIDETENDIETKEKVDEEELERRRFEREQKRLERQRKREEQQMKDEEKRLAKEAREKKKQELYERMAAIHKADAIDDAKNLEEPDFPDDGGDAESDEFVEGYLCVEDENGESSVVCGRMIETEEGMEFVAGKTIMTDEGEQFVPGKEIETPDGLKFIPGKSIITDDGIQFVPGMTVSNEEKTEFVPGRMLNIEDDVETFVPGQVMATDEGCKFVPGSVHHTESGPLFVPGEVLEGQFVPGAYVETEYGPRCVQGYSNEAKRGSTSEQQIDELESFPDYSPVNNASGVFEDRVEVTDVIGSKKGDDSSMLIQEELASSKTTKQNVLDHENVLVSKAKPVPDSRCVSHQSSQKEKRAIVMNEERILFQRTTEEASYDKNSNFTDLTLDEVQLFLEPKKSEISNSNQSNKNKIDSTNETNKNAKVSGHSDQPAPRKRWKFIPKSAGNQNLPKNKPVSKYANTELDDGPLFLVPKKKRTAFSQEAIDEKNRKMAERLEKKNAEEYDSSNLSERKRWQYTPKEIQPEDLPEYKPTSKYANISLDDEPLFLEPRPREKQVFKEPEYYSRYLHEKQKEEEEQMKLALLKQESEENMYEYTVQVFDLDPKEIELFTQSLREPTPTEFKGCNILDSLQALKSAARDHGTELIEFAKEDTVVPKTPLQVYEGVSCILLDAIKRILHCCDGQTDKRSLKEFTGHLANRVHRTIAEDVNNSVSIGQVETFLDLCSGIDNVIGETNLWIDGLFGRTKRGVFRALDNKVICRQINSSVPLTKTLTDLIEAYSAEIESARLKDCALGQLAEMLGKSLPQRNHVDDHREKTQEIISAIILASGKLVLNDIFNSIAYNNDHFLEELLGSLRGTLQEIASDPDTVQSLERVIVVYGQDIVKRQLISFLEFHRKPKLLQREGLSFQLLLQEAAGLSVLEEDDETVQCLRTCLKQPQLSGLLQLHEGSWQTLATVVSLHALSVGDEARQRLLHDLAKYPNVLREHEQWLRLLSAGRVLVQFAGGIRHQRLNTAADIADEVIAALANQWTPETEQVFHAVVLHATRHVYAVDRAETGGGPPVVVMKHQFEGVLPRDVAVSVINGRVEYLLVDETGVRFFRVGEVDGQKLERLERASHWAEFAPKVELVDVSMKENARKMTSRSEITEEMADGLSVPSNKRVKLESGLDIDLHDLDVEEILDHSAAKHKIQIRPQKQHSVALPGLTQGVTHAGPQGSASMARPPTAGRKASGPSLSPAEIQRLQDQRGAVVRELLETEHEFVRDTQFILENYYRHMDMPQMPRALHDYKAALFGNFAQLCDFHSRELLEGIKYYADEPIMIGKTFLRLAPEFDKHAIYCREEPNMQAVLQDNRELKEYFQDYRQRLNDEKSLREHLKLPIQRINDYQLLLKDLLHLSAELHEDYSDLQRALDFILAIPQRSRDLEYINNIQGYRGSLHRLGRLIRHDWFSVTESGGGAEPQQKYVFLFKSQILICAAEKVNETTSWFHLQHFVQLSLATVSDVSGDTLSVDLKSNSTAPYPLLLKASSSSVAGDWLDELHQLAIDRVLYPDHTGVGDEETLGEAENGTVLEIYHSEADPRNASRIGGTTQVTQLTLTANQQPINPVTSSEAVVMETTPVNGEQHFEEDVIAQNGNSTFEIDESLPIFVEKIKGYNCEPGERARFECRVESDPPAVVTWLRNNRPLDDRLADRVMITSDLDRHTLKVLNCMEQDSGLICAKAVNSNGYSVCSAMLEVQAVSEEERRERKRQLAPEFSIHLKDTEILLKAAVVLMVKAEGNPEPKLQFFKDDQPLVQNDRVCVVRDQSGSHELHIHQVLEEDAGVYRCVATNNKGTQECQGNITVTELKDLGARNDERDGKQKSVINAKCGVGIGVRVDGGSETKSETTKTKKSETPASKTAANKKAKKVPTGGRKTAPSKSKPEVGDNEAAVFDLLDKQKALTDTAGTDFTWFKDGEEFDPAERFKVLFKDEEDTLALVFQHVVPEDAGLYTCVAATESGRISCAAELTVAGAVKQLPSEPEAPSVVEPLENTEATLGGSAMLECKMRGYPAVNVTWLLNGHEVKSNERFKVLYEDCESMALVIRSVAEEDAGLVTLVARNNLGECSTEARLLVKCCPKMLIPMNDVAIMCEEPVKIEANIMGVPSPDVKWYKDGQRIMESDRIRFNQESDTRFVMLIDRMSLQDAGAYSIVAANSMGQMSEFWKVVAQAPPKFTKQLFRETIRSEQENAVLEVKIQGSPVPQLKWFRNGEELAIDGRHYSVENDGHIYALIVANVTREDSATYECTMNNDFGTDETSTRLHVRCAPQIECGLEDRDVHEKKPFSLEVKMSGYPDPVIRWYIGEMEITEEWKRYIRERGDGWCRLTVESADSEIIGQYSCQLKNELGSCQTTGFINVLKAPEFVQPLSDLGWDEDKSLTITAVIHAVPEPEISWYRDGEEIQSSSEIALSRDGDQYILHFPTLKEAHQGEYSIRAVNSQGENTSTMSLTVYTKPQILTKFTDQICFITENKILTIQGYGNPIPDPHWFMDNVEIHSSEDYVIQQDKHKYKLTIPRVRYEDAGQYKLVLKNHMGETTDQCKVVVKPLSELKEPHFFTHIFDETKRKGDEVNMTVEIRGNPQPEVRWYKDGVEMAPDTSVMMSYDLEACTYTLKIRRLNEDDMGTYTCSATNEYSTEEEQAFLEVVFKPEIFGLREIPVVPGESAQLVATIKSNPKCRLKWQHDQKDIKPSENIAIVTNADNTETTLTIRTVDMFDGGVYSVIAENSIGQTITNGVVLLRTAVPTFTQRLLNTGVKLGDKLQLEATVSGLPVPEVTWFKDEVPLEVAAGPDGCYCYQVEEVTSPQYGKYRIIAINCVGSAESECRVSEVVIPPVIEGRLPSLSRMDEGEKLVLEVTVDGSPQPDVAWYFDNELLASSDRVQMEHTPDGIYRLTVHELRLEDAGRYRLVASSGNGQAATETAVTVDRVLSRPRFESPLEDITVTIGRPLKLETRVLGYPKPAIKWLKNGVPLSSSARVTITSTPQGTTILDIEAVTPEDAGNYTIMVVNDLGEESTDAGVTVEPVRRKPCLLERLEPARAVEGYSVRIEGRCGGYPAPVASWFLDGQPLEDDDGRHVRVYSLEDGTFGVEVTNCSQKDAGVYSVCVANKLGRLQAETTLDVIGKNLDGTECPPIIKESLRDSEVNEGGHLLLSVDVAGNPLPEICWSKDNLALKTDERVFTSYDGEKVTLSIRPARVRDAGRYHLVVSSDLGQDDCCCAVRVKKTYQAPHFTQKIVDIQQLPGYDAKFIGRVSANPRADIDWLFNDLPITSTSARYRIKLDSDMCALHVLDCRPEDVGIYTCVARNVDGEARCSAHLDIVEKIERRARAEAPYFLKTIAMCEVFPGMQGKFTACVAGSPEPQFEWYKNDTRLLASDRVVMETDGCGLIRLIIKNVDERDAGRYRLKIYNVHGDAACEGDLIFDALDGGYPNKDVYRSSALEAHCRPGAPIPLSDRPLISRMTERQLTLSWHPSSTAGHREPVTYQVEMAEMPRGDWFTVRTGVRGCSVEVRNLDPYRDYKFRIRVENKNGVSDASPYITTQREKLAADGVQEGSVYLTEGEAFRPDSSINFPRNFNMETWSAGRSHAPVFLPQPHSAQYFVPGSAANVSWRLYGWPKPELKFLFNGKPLQLGDGYRYTYSNSGEVDLSIDRPEMNHSGIYELLASNSSGESRQVVSLRHGRAPVILQAPDPLTVLTGSEARIQVRFSGVPAPSVSWYRDWRPLVTTDRVRALRVDDSTAVLLLHECMPGDEGLYTLVIRNSSGMTMCSASLFVEKDEALYSYLSYSPGRCIKPDSRLFEDFYLIGDEIGRGTQAVVYHVAERRRGRNFAAKRMYGSEEFLEMMKAERHIMSQLNNEYLVRLYQAFDSTNHVTLVQELCAGGSLLHALSARASYTEAEIARVVRQILRGLSYMHHKHIGHLGLTIGDVLYVRPGGDEIKLSDFSFSRHINPVRPQRLNYGMPEFVAPELVNDDVVTSAADMWSLGVITHILLSGVSPFRGETDRETLTNIKSGRLNIDEEAFRGVSESAKDFISKLLVYSAEGRMSADTALAHPWLAFADRVDDHELYEISTDRLKLYHELYRRWYSNASCHDWFRRRTLQSAFTDPSCMVYPPGEPYRPPPPPDFLASNWRPPQKESSDCLDGTWRKEWEAVYTEDGGTVTSESRYQQGPETFLLQLRDTGLPSRLRRYMKVASQRSPSFAKKSREDPLFSRSLPSVHERRKFADILNYELDESRRRRISGYGSQGGMSPPPDRFLLGEQDTVYRVIHRSTGSQEEDHVDQPVLPNPGQLPFLREKPVDCAIIEGELCEMTVIAAGDPVPTVQWFRNDLVLGETKRIRIDDDGSGKSTVFFDPVKNFDQGQYKVVAKNKWGTATSTCRMFVGGVPQSSVTPEVKELSDTEVMLRWRLPQNHSRVPVISYHLQYKHLSSGSWIDVADNIQHQFFLVRGLTPSETYHFRLRCRNVVGWGQFGDTTPIVHTRKSGWPNRVQLTRCEKRLQLDTEGGHVTKHAHQSALDYSVELRPLPISHDEAQLKQYSYLGEISRGSFSIVIKCEDTMTNTIRAAKLITKKDEFYRAEIDLMTSMRHESIAALFDVYDLSDRCVLIMECLHGVDVLSHFRHCHIYTEDSVAMTTGQLLDALQYLHWRGIAHLNIQPDNIVMTSCGRYDIKLVDMGSAMKVDQSSLSSPSRYHTDFAAPEILLGEEISTKSDVWSVGVLVYLLLSGQAPFTGTSQQETLDNTMHVRLRYDRFRQPVTAEVTRFLMMIFKREISKRPTSVECSSHRWLHNNDYMQTQREGTVLHGEMLQDYCDRYQEKKRSMAEDHSHLCSCFGVSHSEPSEVDHTVYTTF